MRREARDRGLCRVLLWVALIAGSTAGQEPDGTVADPARWSGPRGTAAGTFRSAAMPILGDIEEAWSFALPGEPAGPPVLWDGVAYILCRDGPRGRTLFAIDVLTGVRLAKKGLPAGPLSPLVVSDGLVILKLSAKQLIAYRLRGRTLFQRWKPVIREATKLGDPLVIEDEVYVTVNGGLLYRLRPGRSSPVWKTTGLHAFVGRLAAYGDHVFALHHAALAGHEASLQLVTFQRKGGVESGRTNIAWYHAKQVPENSDGAEITIVPGWVYVRATAPLASEDGGLSTAYLPCTVRRLSVAFDLGTRLVDLVAAPAWHSDGVLGLGREKKGLAWHIRNEKRGWIVSSAGDQPDLFRHPVPATVLGKVAYFGSWAADLETEDVLWRLPVKALRFAAVPADRLVLVVDQNTLRAFRGKGTGPAATRGKGSAQAALAVGRDGTTLLEGELLVSFDERTILRRKKSHDLRAFYLVEQADGKFVWAPDFTGRIRGYEFMARARLRGTLTRLVKEAAKAKADAVARRYLEAAKAIGLAGKGAASLEKKVRAAERRPKQASPELLKRWEADAARARGLLPELLAERARVEFEKGDQNTGLRVLREALRRDAKCAPALALLRKRSPKDFLLGPPDFWLDLHLDLETAGAKVASDEELELKRARYHWRKDVYGLRAGPILLITPIKDTGVVGRCLAYGRMTCRVLGELFAIDTPHKRKKTPLTIHLFESKKEYEAKSGVYHRLEDPEMLKWTSGHYSPTESLSRFFWFKDPTAERRIAATCVHELTHHWLREQSPRYAASQIRRRPTTPGHWIVEGFATFMQEGIYDVERGTWSLFNPRSRSLDYVLALARTKTLIDWKRLYGITPRGFDELGKKDGFGVVSRWMLGKRVISESSVFYKQAAATCLFLYHANDGMYRGRLLDYVAHNYRGQADKMDPVVAFGMTAAELGGRVVRFAQQVAQGWRPKRR